MYALILAAGQGTRMGNINKPKCLLDIGGTTLIDYQINCLKHVGITDIFVVTGYNSDMIHNHLNGRVTFLYNSSYATTNNVYSMWLAKEFLTDDFICLYADLFFDKQILQNCLDDKNDICLVIETNIREETMRVRIKNNYIVEINKFIPKDLAHGNFIGMAKFKKNSIKSLFNEISTIVNDGDHNFYYTSAIESMIKKGKKVGFVKTNNLTWLDIDEKPEFEEAKHVYQKMRETSS